jgi:hypothetical protein
MSNTYSCTVEIGATYLTPSSYKGTAYQTLPSDRGATLPLAIVQCSMLNRKYDNFLLHCFFLLVVLQDGTSVACDGKLSNIFLPILHDNETPFSDYGL